MRLLRKRYVKGILAILVLNAGFAQTPAPAVFDGEKIVNLAFEPARQPLEDTELLELLPVKSGEPYRAADIRASIERLYATGRYRDIQVDANPVPGGVEVRFITKNGWFIGTVSAEGDFAEPPSRGQVVNASRLELGSRFDEDQIPGAVAGIRKVLVDNGYFSPVIDTRYRYDEAHQQVHITFAVRTGKRARYTDPLIVFKPEPAGTSVLTEKQIVKATGWRRFLLPGYDGITATGTRRGIDRIRLKYEKADRILATVVLNGIEETDNKHGQPRITVDPGTRVEVKALGAKVSQKQLRSTIPVFEEHAVDPDLLAEGVNTLRSYFQSQGYFEADVSFQQKKTVGGTTEIDYLVARGPLHRLVHLDIEGNRFFNAATIRERMFIAPRSLELRRGRYSETFRRRDTEAIQSLYELNGFRDAAITSRTVDNYNGKRGDVAVFFAIEEGPQYTVASLRVNRSAALDISGIVESLSSQKGQPFSEFNVAADRETLIAEYGEHGFSHATFEWDSKPGTLPHTFDLEFTIVEGARQFVRDVVVTGLKATRPGLAEKQFQLGPGSPLSPAAMADTQRRLEDLGIFAEVNMAVQNPDGDEGRKYVVYNLEEANKYSLTTGVGVEFARIGGSNAITDLSDPGGGPGVSPRVSVDLTRLNFLGRGQSVNLQGRLSTLQKRVLMNYFIPKPLNYEKLDATLSVLYDDTHDVRTFESKREEVSAQLAQHFSKAMTFFYRVTYRHVGLSGLKIDPLLVPQLAQSVRAGIASFNLVQDRRDDPIDPHKGIYNTLDLGLATKVFGSQTSFARLLGRNATYYRIGRKAVLARETQIGIQPAFAVQSNADTGDPIPLPERFFGGGGNTQRGVPENQAGPRDLLTGFPLGGSALFFNNTELRFPLLGANVNGVLFEDAGNIYSSLSHLSFRASQKNIADFNYMVHAVGFGIRYRTPVGPVRIDLAYSVNPPRFNGFPGNYSQLVTCSVAGTCQAAPQQISHFQFFFSIGQAF